MEEAYQIEEFITEPLTPKEEKELFSRMRYDELARDTLIEKNIRLVPHVIKKRFRDTPFTMGDLFSAGMVGLIKAVDSFDSEKGYKFSTYACTCIGNDIGILFRKKRVDEIHLEEVVSTDVDGNTQCLYDILPDMNDPLLKLQEDMDLSCVRAAIFSALDCLTSRQREVICMKYGLNGEEPMSQLKISTELGLSQAQISRVERRALSLLSPILESAV